jgi:hypothetical protein
MTGEVEKEYLAAVRNLDPETSNAKQFFSNYQQWGNKHALKMTAERKAAIVKYVQNHGPYKGKLCRGFEISMNCLNHHLNTDEDFKTGWDLAVSEYYDALENEAYRRAFVGEMEPVIGGKDKDQIVTYIARKSDRLMEVMLKARRGDIFKDKVQVDQTIHSGVLAVQPANAAPDDWETTHGDAARGGSADPSKPTP